MARLTDTLKQALGNWFNLINDEARKGFTADQVVKSANNVAKDLGRTISFKENQAISQLYGYVRREINAGNQFQAAASNRAIDANMVSVPPYARDEVEQATYPLYHVRFEYTYIDQAGNTQTSYKTSVFNDVLPGTVGELTADVLDDAEAMANKYGHTLLSAIPIAILAV